jgi:poly(hydroxyalkanoate) depolymerase family esterase
MTPLLVALALVTDFGPNPGALLMYEHVPAGLPADAPVVVVMHGCTQTAASMEPAGWNALADQLGFVVVYPEQTPENNPARCFNWAGEYGDPANMVRGQGENASILAMIDHALEAHDGDPSRVFVTGFSAGGGFTAVMLATWPDRIAAGAILSGVPYRCADSVATAFDCQQLDLHPERDKSGEAWAALVEAGSGGHAGAWPRVAIWHGSSDGIVDPRAADELVEQWTAVHGEGGPPVVELVDGQERQRWGAVERWTLDGMGHAVALGGDGCAAAAAFFEDRGVCSTRRIASFFGLDGSGGEGEPPVIDDEGGGCRAGGGAGLLVILLALLPVRARRG